MLNLYQVIAAAHAEARILGEEIGPIEIAEFDWPLAPSETRRHLWLYSLARVAPNSVCAWTEDWMRAAIAGPPMEVELVRRMYQAFTVGEA